MRFGAITALGAGLGLLVSACGPSRESWPAGRPRIDRVDFLEQTPLDPTRLAFGLEYTDTDGDLGAGVLELSIDDRLASSLPLPDVFAAQMPPLDPGLSVGRFEVFVKVDGGVSPGERVRIGFVLQDAAGGRSNQPTVTLEAFQRSGG